MMERDIRFYTLLSRLRKQQTKWIKVNEWILRHQRGKSEIVQHVLKSNMRKAEFN